MDLLELTIKLNLVLFNYSYCHKTCDKIKYLRSKKSGIKDSINQNFERIRIDSYNSLPIDKILAVQNVTILIISVVNKNKNKNYYNIFLEKVRIKINPMQSIFK